MKRGTWIALAFAFGLTTIVAASAHAQVVWQPFDTDGMCQDNTGNWVMCDSMGGDGMGGGGTTTKCTRRECWFCRPRPGQPSECGTTSQPVEGPMGCECKASTTSFDDCDMKKTSCSIG